AAAFFITNDALVPEDTDAIRDVYERVGGTTKLVTTWPSTRNIFVPAVATDGSRLIILTAESLVSQDTDTVADLYALDLPSGQITLLSTGSGGGSEASAVGFEGATPDASVVWFRTFDRLTADDVDTGPDLY